MATTGAKGMTAQEALAKWDAGEILWSVEMGGLGPGYEQAIQLLVFEIIRDGEPLPKPDADGLYDLWDWSKDAVTRANGAAGGFSGAQVGAAKGLAARALLNGWDGMLAHAPADRKIQISKNWPRA